MQLGSHAVMQVEASEKRKTKNETLLRQRLRRVKNEIATRRTMKN
jgi:hypothetical protein